MASKGPHQGQAAGNGPDNSKGSGNNNNRRSSRKKVKRGNPNSASNFDQPPRFDGISGPVIPPAFTTGHNMVRSKKPPPGLFRFPAGDMYTVPPRQLPEMPRHISYPIPVQDGDRGALFTPLAAAPMYGSNLVPGGQFPADPVSRTVPPTPHILYPNLESVPVPRTATGVFPSLNSPDVSRASAFRLPADPTLSHEAVDSDQIKLDPHKSIAQVYEMYDSYVSAFSKLPNAQRANFRGVIEKLHSIAGSQRHVAHHKQSIAHENLRYLYNKEAEHEGARQEHLVVVLEKLQASCEVAQLDTSTEEEARDADEKRKKFLSDATNAMDKVVYHMGRAGTYRRENERQQAVMAQCDRDIAKTSEDLSRAVFGEVYRAICRTPTEDAGGMANAMDIANQDPTTTEAVVVQALSPAPHRRARDSSFNNNANANASRISKAPNSQPTNKPQAANEAHNGSGLQVKKKKNRPRRKVSSEQNSPGQAEAPNSNAVQTHGLATVVPAKFGPQAPVRSSPATPVKAGPSTPIKLGPTAAIKPGPSTPVKFGSRIPAKPGPTTPLKPSPEVPIKPSPQVPAKFSPQAPVKFGPKAPVKSSPTTPIKPSPTTSVKPSLQIPADPSTTTPAKPMSKSPVKLSAMAPVLGNGKVDTKSDKPSTPGAFNSGPGMSYANAVAGTPPRKE